MRTIKVPRKVSSCLANFLRAVTTPQRAYLVIYLVGLIWLVKFRSIREIASKYGQENTDGLHQFMTASPKKNRKLQSENQRQIAAVCAGEKAIFILDDTPCPRKGKKIEGLGIHHGADGFIRGLCAVTSILKIGTQRFCWAIRGYRPKGTCRAGTFKSKVQLAVEILTEAIQALPVKPTVLMDAWYSCAAILNLIIQAGWTFVAAVKRNRLVEINGKKISLSSLAKGPRKYKTIRVSRKKCFRVAKLQVQLPKIGAVLLFISKSRKDGIRFFITNDLKMTESQMVALYLQRVWIETFHQDIKQHLGFGEVFMRSWDGVQAHWALVGIAYNLIALWNGNKSRSFRQMIRHFRDSVDPNTVLGL
ncbi:MAG TPA: transposase [Candidatus Omnitrophota bacterium]|nr:transposase [Candidatus Omnitrophota bacterium]